MITPEQYERLKPYIGAIRDRACSGSTGPELAQIHLEWTGYKVNLHCRVCQSDMMNYFNNIVIEYEQANRQNP